MAPLSIELSELILPRDSYGTHLDDQRKTPDEKMNFQNAVEVLTEVCNNMIIDGYDVVTEWVEPNDNAESFIRDLPQWYSEHVSEIQYLHQVQCIIDYYYFVFVSYTKILKYHNMFTIW